MITEGVKRKLAAILSADVKDYSRLTFIGTEGWPDANALIILSCYTTPFRLLGNLANGTYL
jgi:hypothetical protein